MDNKLTSIAFKQLLKNDNVKLIHGVLSTLNITPNRSDYQDLFQEGCLFYVQAYEDFFSIHSIEDLELFDPYAFRRIKWRLLDIIRKEIRQQEHIDSIQVTANAENEYDLPDSLATQFEADILTSAFFQELWNECTMQEQAYLANRVAGMSITKMAQLIGCSRQSIYKWRNSVIKKALKIIEK